MSAADTRLHRERAEARRIVDEVGIEFPRSGWLVVGGGIMRHYYRLSDVPALVRRCGPLAHVIDLTRLEVGP